MALLKSVHVYCLRPYFLSHSFFMIVFDYLKLNSWSNMAFGVRQCEENHKSFINSTIFATWCTCELHTQHTESNY